MGGHGQMAYGMMQGMGVMGRPAPLPAQPQKSEKELEKERMKARFKEISQNKVCPMTSC